MAIKCDWCGGKPRRVYCYGLRILPEMVPSHTLADFQATVAVVLAEARHELLRQWKEQRRGQALGELMGNKAVKDDLR